jgi:hypothetical protein
MEARRQMWRELVVNYLHPRHAAEAERRGNNKQHK